MGRGWEGGEGTDLAAAIPFPAVAPSELLSSLPQRPFRAGKHKVSIGCSSSLCISQLKEVRQGSQGFAGHIEERMIHAGKVPPPPVTQV